MAAGAPAFLLARERIHQPRHRETAEHERGEQDAEELPALPCGPARQRSAKNADTRKRVERHDQEVVAAGSERDHRLLLRPRCRRRRGRAAGSSGPPSAGRRTRTRRSARGSCPPGFSRKRAGHEVEEARAVNGEGRQDRQRLARPRSCRGGPGTRGPARNVSGDDDGERDRGPAPAEIEVAEPGNEPREDHRDDAASAPGTSRPRSRAGLGEQRGSRRRVTPRAPRARRARRPVDRHEVGVARPARHDVDVVVTRDAGAGRASEVDADVQAVGLVAPTTRILWARATVAISSASVSGFESENQAS